MNKRYLALLGLSLCILAGVFLFLRLHRSVHQTKQSINHPAALPKEVTVTLDKDGFTPQEVTLKVDSAIRWKNISGDKQTVNSDDYPTNQLHRELNFGIFASGSSVTYTFIKTGTYGYHNQLHPEQNGKITVVK